MQHSSCSQCAYDASWSNTCLVRCNFEILLATRIKSLALKKYSLSAIEWMLQPKGESSADLSPQHWQINPFLYSFVWFLLISGLFSEFLPSPLFVFSLTFHLWKETVEFDDSISFAPIPQVDSGRHHTHLRKLLSQRLPIFACPTCW